MATQITNIISNSNYEGSITYLVFAPDPLDYNNAVVGTLTVTNADGLGNTVVYDMNNNSYSTAYGAYQVTTAYIGGSPSFPVTREGKLTAKLTVDADPYVMNYKHFSNGYYNVSGDSGSGTHSLPQGLGVTYTNCDGNGLFKANFFSEPPNPEHENETSVGSMRLSRPGDPTLIVPTAVYRNNLGFPDLTSTPTWCATWTINGLTDVTGSGIYTVQSLSQSINIDLELSCCDNFDLSAPILSATSVAEACPSNTFNLTTITGSNANGRVLQFHTVANPTSTGTLVSNPSAVTSGNYYAVYLNTECGGYSQPTVVTVADTVCVSVTAQPDTATTIQGSSVTINVLANDDVSTCGGTITVATSGTQSNGTFVVNLDNTITATPTPGYFGNNLSTGYTILCDGQPTGASSTLTVTVQEVTATLVNDTNTTTRNTQVSGNISTNDGGCTIGTKSYVQSVGMLNGGLTLSNTGVYTYTPDVDFVGVDTATIQVFCGAILVGTTTLTITVNDTTDTLVPDTARTTINQMVTVNPLLNDTINCGGTITIGISNPVNGTFTVVGTSVQVTPSNNYVGESVTADYTVSCNGTPRGTSTITVGVDAANITDNTAITNMNTPVTIPAGADDVVNCGGVVTYSIVSGSSQNGTFVIDSNGVITATPALNYFGGGMTAEYQVRCDNVLIGQATVTVQVRGAVLVNDIVTTTINTPVSGNVSLNDTIYCP